MGCALEPLEDERRCTGMPICGRTWWLAADGWDVDIVGLVWLGICRIRRGHSKDVGRKHALALDVKCG